MEKRFFKKIFSVGIALVLVAAMALFGSACGKEEKKVTESMPEVVEEQTVFDIGAGATEFRFVVENDGLTKEFHVKTDKTIVGEALSELNLISGSEGPYGLMVSTVDGVTLDYDSDGKYWAFYENNKYAATGVDKTEIKPDTVYSFKGENG